MSLSVDWKKDLKDQGTALLHWFLSQGIDPNQGTVLMIYMLANVLAFESSTSEKLEADIQLQNKALAVMARELFANKNTDEEE